MNGRVVIVRQPPRTSSENLYLAVHSDTNRKLVRYPGVQNSSLYVLQRILVPEWSSEQCFCRAEFRNHVEQSFINYDSEWVLKEIVRANLYIS